MKRVAILISGGGSNMVALCDSMTGEHPARPVLVLSDQPRAGGLAKAAARDIPSATVARSDHTDKPAFEAAMIAALDAHIPDFICLAGFMRILSPEFVARYDGRILNIHPSLLPKYKGLDTHARAIAAGDSHSGCSVHVVTAALDDGPILGQASVSIAPQDTAASLAAKTLAQEHRLYPAVLRRFVNGDMTCLTLP